MSTLQIRMDPVGKRASLPRFFFLMKFLPSLSLTFWQSKKLVIRGKSAHSIELNRGTKGQIPSFLASSGALKPYSITCYNSDGILGSMP